MLIDLSVRLPVNVGHYWLSLWGVKSYIWIFACSGVRAPNSSTVQGQTYFLMAVSLFILFSFSNIHINKYRFPNSKNSIWYYKKIHCG